MTTDFRNCRRRVAIFAMFLSCLVAPNDVSAQQVPTDPTSTHIFPAGGRRGTIVDVRVGGECLPPGTRFRLFGEGVSAPPELGAPANGKYAPSPRRKPSEQPTTYPREWKSLIEISSDAPLGVKLWRLSCARGGMGGRPFIVGDLPEFIEEEPNSVPSEAQRIELPVTINGQIAGENDLDYFRFDATAGDVVRVDLAAARLGSFLDPILQVTGPDGQRVTVDDLRIGADPVIAFRAAVSGEYRLIVANVTYRGGPSYVYRATISTAPLVQFAFPPGGRSGTNRTVAFFAPTGSGSRRTISEDVQFPDFVGEFWRPGPSGANSFPFIVGELPEEQESVNNDRRESATELAWPTIMNGQFETRGDEDWFRLTCQKDVPLQIDCTPYPRWSPSLPLISITNVDGAVLVSTAASQSAQGPIHLEWKPPADGQFWLRLRDVQQGIRGGDEFIYRLRVQQAVPEFVVSMKVDAVSVVQGGRTEVDVSVERRGGFTAPVELVVEGLPEGVRIEGQQVPANQPGTKLIFIADAEARSRDVTLRISGKAEINGAIVQRSAQATHLGHDVDGVALGGPVVDHVQLTVVHKPVFKLYCNEAYQYAHRGTVYPYLMEVERLDGFDGPIKLQMADRQIKDLDGVEIVDTTIAPGQTQVMLPLYFPETMHINVQAHSNIYAQGYVEFEDKFGQKQTLLVVSTMRCMVRTLPAIAKLRVADRELPVAANGAIRCPLVLDRTSQFSGSMQIELIDAVPGISAKPVEIKPDQTRADLVLQIDPTVKQAPKQSLRFRARGKMSDDVQVISEADVPLAIANSPEAR